MASITYDEAMLLSGGTNATITGSTQPTRGFSSGWIEWFVPFANDLAGTISIKGGLDSTQSTHQDLELDPDQIFANGVSINDSLPTGVTAPVDATPGTITIANTLAADTRFRIPLINAPAYISAVYTRTGGGSASETITCKWYGTQAT